MEPVVLDGFDIEIDRGEVQRMLGSKTGAPARGGARLDELLDGAIARARELVHPRGIYVIAPGASLPGSRIFEKYGRMAFCVCTIGPELEAEVTALGGSGRLLAAVALDAAGSVAAEAAAQYADDRIRREAARDCLRTSCRASPGYGDWDITGQRGIFELIPAGRIGVTLSEACMMSPRKSVSFAVHIDENPVRLRSESSCANCDRTDCPYRLHD